MAFYKNNSSETQANKVREQDILAMALIFTLTALFVPLHNYDHTIFFTVVILLVMIRWSLAIWLIPGIIAVARSGHITDVVDMIGIHHIDMLVISLGIIYLSFVIMMIIWKNRIYA